MLARTAAYCAVALALAAAIGSTTLWAPVHAADLDDVLDRVDRLQRELNALQRQVYRGEVPAGAGSAAQSSTAGDLEAGPIAARINIRLNALEQELQQLTGMIEEIRFRTDQANQRVDKLVGDVDFRLSQIERTVGISTAAPPAGTAQGPAGEMGQAPQGAPAQTGLAAAPGAETAAPPPTESTGTLFEGQFQQAQQRAGSGQQRAAAAPPPQSPASTAPATPVAQTILPDAPPEDRYTFAFNLLRKQNYDAAEAAFSAFLTEHGDHALAGNAQYWLGETYYVRERFKDAASAFLVGYKTYPDNNKAPDNLLKLGMSLGKLGQTEEACRSLSRLADEFPNAKNVIKQRAQTHRRTLKCPTS